MQCNPYPLTPFGLIEQAISLLETIGPDIVIVAGASALLLPLQKGTSQKSEGAVALSFCNESFARKFQIEPLAYCEAEKLPFFLNRTLHGRTPFSPEVSHMELVGPKELEENLTTLFSQNEAVETRSLRSLGIHLPLPLQGLLACLKSSYDLILNQHHLQVEPHLPTDEVVIPERSKQWIALGYDEGSPSHVQLIKFLSISQKQKPQGNHEPTLFLLSAPSSSEMKSLLIELWRWHDLGFWQTVSLKQIACLIGLKSSHETDRKAIIASTWEQFQEGLLSLLQEESTSVLSGSLDKSSLLSRSLWLMP